MKNTFRLSLKANEKLYLNGAVIRVDRKTSIEILNDVNFLLENHVLQAADANTPLKQIYFVVQLMLMAPSDTKQASELFRHQMRSLLNAFQNPTVLASLKDVDRLVCEGKTFEAMKTIRSLFPIEEEIMHASGREIDSANDALPHIVAAE